MKNSVCNYAFTAATLLTALFSGCRQQEPIKPVAQEIAPPAQLRLAIVDDPTLAAAIQLDRGEWKAESGSDLDVVQLTGAEIEHADKLDADAVICPTALLGTLAERRLIRPFNKSWLTGDPLEAADLLQPPDSLEFTWDGQQYAVPMGSPMFLLFYRADLLEQFHKQPPRTWVEYQALAQFFADRKNLQSLPHIDLSNWQPTAEPLASGWASDLFLARAAAYAKHRDYIYVLFDRDTMQPLIAGAPFVRALEELKATAKLNSAGDNDMSPSESIALLLAGKAALAIGFPNRSAKSSASFPIGVAELPGSENAYNLGHSAWEPRRSDEDAQIPLRGISGRVGSVVRGGEHAEAAFKLLAWVGGRKWSSELLSSDPASAPFRQSQLAEPQRWLGQGFDAQSAKQYAQALATSLHCREALLMPRFPGQGEYLAALDEAVHLALTGKKTSQQALDDAAAAWKKITEKYGQQNQLEAYRRSLKAP